MLLYASNEDSETYTNVVKSTADLPVGVPIIILADGVTSQEADQIETIISRVKEFYDWN